MLQEETLDIGIVRTPLLQPHGATLLTLQRDRFVAALPASHPLASQPSLRLADLSGQPFVMYNQAEAAGLYASAMAACEAAGFAPEVSQEATQIATVLAIVESGLGIALVPEVVRGQRDPHVIYRDLVDAGQTLDSTLALAYEPGNETPAILRFIDASKILQVA
jgi:DNA-binding transcriptional LysR family regulator